MPCTGPQDSWSTTVQLALLVFTALLALGLVPLLLLASNRYLGSAMFSPVKTPTASATQVGRRRAQRLQQGCRSFFAATP